MFRRPWLSLGFFVPMLVALLLVVAVSCGDSATSTTAPQATAAPAATAVPAAATNVPAAAATAAPIPTPLPMATSVPVVAAAPAALKPFGTLDFADKEIGVYQGWPGETGFPQWSVMVATAFEGLFSQDVNGDFYGRLAVDWSVSPDLRVWTIKLRKGVQFHAGWGEVTAEDFIWSANELAVEGSKGGHGVPMRRIYQDPTGYLISLDDYTIELDTGKPYWDVLVTASTPGTDGVFVVSKKQALELEASVGDRIDVNAQGLLVGTGPWEKVETRTGEFWKFKAVEDHYDKTPFFAELVIHEIPEESTRIANFQVGKVDLFAVAPDSTGPLAEIEGTKFMSQEKVGQSILNIHGQYYWHAGTDKEKPGYNPDLPYVSSNPDTSSPEWAQAVKVRKAMGLAIDRDLIVEELLGGEGGPISMHGWMGHDAQAEPNWVWEYDLETAKRLLKEAGYEDGFEVTLTPAIRGGPAEVEACEAIGDMWADIGITARIQQVPYIAVREAAYGRTESGITCHSTAPFMEPLILQQYMWFPDVGWTDGLSHQFLTSATGAPDEPNPGIFERAFNEADTEKRWDLQRELGNWLWDNALDIGLYYFNNTYALGPEVDSWAEHLNRGDPRRISALEWAPHRQ